MEIAIMLFFVWMIITVIGHGSWVMIRGFFRLFSDQPRHQIPLPDERSDIAATRRVVGRMVAKNLLDEPVVAEFRDQLRNLEHRQTTSTIHPTVPPDPWWDSTVPVAETVADQDAGHDEPITATLADAASAMSSSTPATRPPQPATAASLAPQPPLVPAEPTHPTLSKAEVIQSFLAAHNIRWGELVAGMLIVICSIGLVISLWSQLVGKHRVIPSLIFLGANAAIYAAGLYTLSRWRLRHTSRAVLVIATLLVPLSVLAGLAAAGTGDTAVQLSDPITLGAIGLAGAIYLLLLYLGGKALSHGWYAVPTAMVVAGPAAVLPLVPASVRVFEQHAGWIVVAGSLAILLASIRINRPRSGAGRSLGVASSRARLLVMAFGGFALAASIGYAAFAVREFGWQANLPIAIATIPALVALAGTARSLMISSRSHTQSMIGAVTCVILIALAWTALPPSTSAASWLWSWGLVFSISAAVVGWLFHQPRWLALATLPSGVAATLSSPVWLGQQSWAETLFWNRVVGGEPMLAATLVAILVASASRFIRDSDRRVWIEYAAILWAGLALTIASVLSLAPESLLGIAPWWSVTLVLVAGSIVSVALSTRWQTWSLVTIGAVAFTWLSVFRPIQWNDTLGSPTTWIMTGIAIATTLIMLRELVPRLTLRFSRGTSTTLRSGRTWELASVAASVAAGLIACWLAQDNWQDAAFALAVVSALLFWTSTTSKSVGVLHMSQWSTCALAVVIGHGQFWDRLFTGQAWTSGVAIWAWSVVLGIVAALWFLIRQCADWNLSPSAARRVRRRLGHLSGSQTMLESTPDGWAAMIANGLIWTGSAYAFAALLSQAFGSTSVGYESQFVLPVTALAICGFLAWWTRRHGSNSVVLAKLASLWIVTLIVWGSSQFAHVISLSDNAKLILGTTLAAAGCCAAANWVLSRIDSDSSRGGDRIPMVIATLLVASASAVLLWVGWFHPIVEESYAIAFPTLSVAAWWMTAAAVLLWMTKRNHDPQPGIVSALLAPAAIAMIVPVFSSSHPVVWIQVAAIASVGWIAITHFWLSEDEASFAQAAIAGSIWFGLIVGVVSASLVTLSLALNLPSLRVVFGPAGFVISLVAVAYGCFADGRLPTPLDHLSTRLPWPLGLSILAGQIAWLAYELNLVSGVHTIELIAGIWALASAASLLRYRSSVRVTDFIHVGFVSVATAIVTELVGGNSELMPWLALITLAIGGVQVALVGNAANAAKPQLVASRLLGWFVVCVGGFLLFSRIASPSPSDFPWTLLVIWVVVWIVVWRVVCPDTSATGDQPPRESARAIPDTEFAVLILMAALAETVLTTLSWVPAFSASKGTHFLLWGRVAAYLAAGLSTVARGNRELVWSTAIGTLVAASALISVQLSVNFDATSNQRLVWATISSGFAIAFIAHWLPAIARLLGSWAGGSPSVYLRRLIESTWQVALVVASLAGLSAVIMIVSGAPAADSNLTIVAVALSAWAIAEMAEACNGPRLRHAAVNAALITIGLWASVDSGETSHPVLTGLMRWLVASVLTIPMVLFLFPRLLGQSIASRWRDALQRGAEVAGVAAACSLIGMLVVEAVIRTESGIDGISLPMVVGVAVTLAILSGLSGLISILSGPGSSWRDRLKLSDQQRRLLIIASQAIAALAWLHMFLCKTDWAFIGLRAYWPYIVMGLAFASVGATEWARRRGDHVMSDTLSQTALYLPLVPVIGFWLSGSISELDWLFRGERVRYDLLLAIGSVYYIGISAMWKGVVPRIAAIALGNAAWWVVLVQQPGWSFLSHPQAWLIPPAGCVLVVAHLYRERLEPAVASGVRYACTLVIYVSSTADMLLQQIGTNLSGPIILILLALAGMAAGVVLRVRPFLYLGAMFVFLGVTSMVWHANRAFDAVWPWWVFGITTGICLLAGLMAIEKNKPKLREYADRLASWQG